MSTPVTLTRGDVRRLAISKQQLAADPAADLMTLFRALGCVQLDPISAVARSHLLVLWSRLGTGFDPDELDRTMFEARQLFEYWAHAASIVLTDDYPIHAWKMHRHAVGDDDYSQRVREWVAQNDALRTFILAELAEKGALLSRQIEADGLHPQEWVSTGWTSGRNVSRILDYLWTKGEIMVAGRVGGQKQWDLTARVLPDHVAREPLDDHALTLAAAQTAIKALGAATAQQIQVHYTRNRYPTLTEALKELEREGRIVQAQVEDLSGEWYVHADDLPLIQQIQAGHWAGRTALLSPFDNLICDRKRTAQLFDFDFTIEIYVPAAKRKYGYYVLPVLDGDRLIGRIDSAMDRKAKVYRVARIYAEPDAPSDAGARIQAQIESLAAFLGANAVEIGQSDFAAKSAKRKRTTKNTKNAKVENA